jgi:2-dehydro-3-deoxyglucarate aldolase/4-hydroxy-2-oxoheptanedioate aldolase
MSIIRQRLAAGQIVRTMHFTTLSSPKLVELTGILAGTAARQSSNAPQPLVPGPRLFHGIWIDQEHCGISHGDLEAMLIACRAAGLDAFARVPLTDYGAVMRPMEAGCSGVMIAQVRTMDEVQNAVAWAKYPPVGIRGVFGGNYEARFGTTPLATHVAAANRDRWLAVQIETAEGAELVEEIAATDGVDLLFVGPADLSVSLGVPGEFLHPKCIDVLERTSRGAKKEGKWWGTLSRDVEHARRCRELGCQLFSIFGDLDCFAWGLKSIEQRFSELMD